MKVELLNVTESPEKTIEIAARISEGEEIGFDEKVDRKFIRQVMNYGAATIAEHATATFKIKGISRACSHQLVRHRLASYMQKSQRYVNEEDFDYVIPESCKKAVYHKMAFEHMMEKAKEIYKYFIELGIPKEDARFILPNACTTTIIMTANFREWRHIIKQRISDDAQWEIRELMKEIHTHLKDIAPSIFENL